jgi:hypothetical protein
MGVRYPGKITAELRQAHINNIHKKDEEKDGRDDAERYLDDI